MAINVDEYTKDPTIQSLITRLFEAGENLPDDLRRALLVADSRLDHALEAILADPKAAYVRAPGQGWAPLHAASLAAARQRAVRRAG